MKYYYKLVTYTILGILFISCNDNYSRKDHKYTTKLKQGLFVETFTVFGSGAFGTDKVSDYLTDSILFRKYIGSFYEGVENYYYKVSNDTIYVEKYKVGIYVKGKTLLHREQLIISELKKLKNIK